MEILVNVIGQKLKVTTNLKCFISGSQQFVKFIFNMDDSWDNLQTFAQFRQNDVAYNQYLDANNSVYLPREIGAGTCTLILYGTGGNVRATTNYLTLTIDENILVTNAQSTEITQSLYEQLVNSVTTTTNRLQDRVANVENVIQGLAGGAPIVVSSVSEMTDTEQIYILSTDGMWYYHNGTAWVSGGEYGAVATDTTLTQSGAPANAKVVGDEIADLKFDLSETKNEIIRTAGVVEELECGLTEEVKAALLACFAHVAWISDDGQTYYDALSNALNRSRVLSSIRAVFTQGSVTIYDTDELYALKQYLTVTVTYSDGTTKEVNNYTLSGKLVAGTNTITVAYNKKTTTFNVAVTHQAKTLESISATFNPSASITTDNVLDDLRPYLTVRASYSDGSTNTITNYVLRGSLNVGVNTITASYSGKTATFTVNVTQAEVTLQSITATFTQGSAVIYTDNSLNDLKPYLVVTARYSDSTTQTVTDYTLNGTLTKGTSAITVSYGGKTATFDVVVSERTATLQSITATFTQGSAVIYTDSSLNSLKPYLVVTANYSNGTTQTITGYTLSGTLTAGTSTITASYSGKTTTFNVTVTERATPPTPSTNPIYTLTTPATFNGTSDHIDTEMQLVDSNKKNITIVGDLLDKSMPTSGNAKVLFHCMHEASPYPGIAIQMNPQSDTKKSFVLNANSNSASGGYGSIKANNIINDESEGIREKFVAIINNQNSTFTLVGKFNGTYFYETKALPSGYSSTEITETAVIGARKQINNGTTQYDRYWKGTIYDLKIYDYAWDKTEADNYVTGGDS